MARMRIIADAFRQLITDDPDTGITMCGLRRLILSGIIPTIRVGRKVLIDYDQLLLYLSKSYDEIKPAQQEKIRPVI